MDFPDHTDDYTPSRSGPQPVVRNQQSRPSTGKLVNDGHHYHYIVEKFSEGAIGTILLGASSFNPDKLSEIINTHASAGYRMIFQVKEHRRMLLFWKRESILMTFERAIS